MRENRIDWVKFFKPVCILCMVCGAVWLWWQMSLTENLLGRITAIAGGVLLLLGGLFGLLGKPRALVPLLDFLALAASLVALWKIGLCWQAIAGVALSTVYLISCNASTAIGDDGDANEQPDYSELHPYWENMEKIKQEWEENSKEASGKAAGETDTSKTEN